jgi:hypothetical protein
MIHFFCPGFPDSRWEDFLSVEEPRQFVTVRAGRSLTAQKDEDGGYTATVPGPRVTEYLARMGIARALGLAAHDIEIEWKGQVRSM